MAEKEYNREVSGEPGVDSPRNRPVSNRAAAGGARPRVVTPPPSLPKRPLAENVREEMKVFVETDFGKDGKWSSFFKNDWTVTPWQVDGLGRPIIWTCGDLMWKRIWHSIWIALGITSLPIVIILFPILALIDKIIPAAQCFT